MTPSEELEIESAEEYKKWKKEQARIKREDKERAKERKRKVNKRYQEINEWKVSHKMTREEIKTNFLTDTQKILEKVKADKKQKTNLQGMSILELSRTAKKVNKNV